MSTSVYISIRLPSVMQPFNTLSISQQGTHCIQDVTCVSPPMHGVHGYVLGEIDHLHGGGERGGGKLDDLWGQTLFFGVTTSFKAEWISRG